MRNMRNIVLPAAVCLVMAGGAWAQQDLLPAESAAQEQEPGFLQSLTMEDVDITYAVGTDIVQHIEAREARPAPDTISIVANDVLITMNDPANGSSVSVEAPYARYFHAAPEKPLTPEAEPPEDVILGWITDMRTNADEMGPLLTDPARGDIILLDPTGAPMEVDSGGQGSLRVQNMVWSERFADFVSIGPFVQEVSDGQGVLRTTGELFVTNREFSEWHYPLLPGMAPVELEYEVTSE